MQATVERGTTVMRDRARGGGALLFANEKKRSVRVASLDLPSGIYPGGQVSGRVEIENNARGLFPTDKDFCWTSAVGVTGYRMDVRVYANDQLIAEQEKCVPGNGLGTRGLSFSFNTTGSTEQVTVRIEARGTGSGKSMISKSATIPVYNDDEDDGGNDSGVVDCGDDAYYDPDQGRCVPTDTGDDDDSDDPSNVGPVLPCFLDPNQECKSGEQLRYAAIGGGLLLLLARR